jgi:hypothetical protein
MNIRGVSHTVREQHKTFWYYLDELSIFLVLVVAIYIADVASRWHSHHHVTFDIEDWVKVAESVIVAFTVYGGMDSRLRMTDMTKPPWLKRAGKAIAYGISADTIAGWTR